MATFRSIKELTRALQQGSKLLSNMFLQRKTIAVKYDDALDTLDGDENKLKHLITFGVIVQTGDSLELDDAYQRFFEEVLEVNEDINISSVKMYIDKLNLGISSYLAAENNVRRESFMREIRHTFKSIDNATRRNVIDLKRIVDDTYKQEPNFKIKELRLKDFDEKARLIGELIRQTEHVIDEQTIFFSSVSDYGLKQTVSEVRDGLRESAHGLIAITAQIIEYLNRIEYQSRLVKRVRQLKYLRDQFMIEQATNVKEVMAQTNTVWMESKPKYVTRVSLDFLRNEDAALGHSGGRKNFGVHRQNVGHGHEGHEACENFGVDVGLVFAQFEELLEKEKFFLEFTTGLVHECFFLVLLHFPFFFFCPRRRASPF